MVLLYDIHRPQPPITKARRSSSERRSDDPEDGASWRGAACRRAQLFQPVRSGRCESSVSWTPPPPPPARSCSTSRCRRPRQRGSSAARTTTCCSRTTGDRPVGMISGVETTHPDKGTEMFLYELGVDEDARRRGVATALVNALADAGAGPRVLRDVGRRGHRQRRRARDLPRVPAPREEAPAGRVLLGLRDELSALGCTWVPDLVNAWMVGGVLLHLAGQLARGRAWHAVIRAAHGADVTVRRRDVLRAWVAGAGVTGIVSARGGDVVRVLMLRQRLPGTTCATLAGTLAAETVAETACGAVVVGWAVERRADARGRRLGPAGGRRRGGRGGRGRRRLHAPLRAAAAAVRRGVAGPGGAAPPRLLRPLRAPLGAARPRRPARVADLLPARVRAAGLARGGRARDGGAGRRAPRARSARPARASASRSSRWRSAP